MTEFHLVATIVRQEIVPTGAISIEMSLDNSKKVVFNGCNPYSVKFRAL